MAVLFADPKREQLRQIVDLFQSSVLLHDMPQEEYLATVEVYNNKTEKLVIPVPEYLLVFLRQVEATRQCFQRELLSLKTDGATLFTEQENDIDTFTQAMKPVLLLADEALFGKSLDRLFWYLSTAYIRQNTSEKEGIDYALRRHPENDEIYFVKRNRTATSLIQELLR